MRKLVEMLKRLIGERHGRADARRRQRREPQFVGRSNVNEIEQASPERVGELVGHAPERVDT